MPNIIFFNNTPNAIRLILGGIFISFCCWGGILVFEKQQLDPLVKTIGVSIALWGGLFSLYSTLQVKRFYINDQEQFIGYTKGTVLLNKTHIYPFSCIKSLELRAAYVRPDDSDSSDDIGRNSSRNHTKRYYCVLILNDDELYMEGSSDKNETNEHIRELSKFMNIPFKVNLYGRNNSKSAEANILRIVLLLCVILVGMYGLFQFIVEYS
jgi:hypothetical protein